MKNNRKNSKGKGSSQQKSIVKFIPLIVLGVALIGFVAWLIFRPKPASPAKVEGGPVPATKAEAPSSATVYIDNSASMEGYTHGREYISALSDLVSIYNPTDVRFTSNDTLRITSGSELVDRLTNGKLQYSGQSLLNEDLKKIVESVSNGKKNIAFFVTDGIMCGPSDEVRKARENGRTWNLDHVQELMNQISDAFRGKGVGASVYRLVSDFKGQYYDMVNDHKNINGRRAFYIIAIGVPQVVADFKDKLIKKEENQLFTLRPTDEIDFIETRTLNQGLTANGGTSGATILEVNDKDNTIIFDQAKIQNNPVNFIIDLNELRNYTINPKELAQEVEVLVDGSKYKTGGEYDSLSNTIKTEVEWAYIQGPSSGRKITVRIPYFDVPWIHNKNVSNKDDGFMISGNPDESTFLFENFIGGIMGGLLNNPQQFYIYDRTVTLKKK